MSANPRHFFIIGAQRCSTTYLYHMLAAHPQIEMAQPVRPEPKFFLREDFAQLTPQDYLAAHFDEAQKPLLRGEKSTTYIEREEAAQRIAAWYPDAAIVISLRDPIARAVSNYRFSRDNGLETAPLDEAFYNEAVRSQQYDRARFSTSPFAYLQRGRYMDYIEVYLRYFPREQVHIFLAEEYVGQLAGVQAIYRALGADSAFVPPNYAQRYNASAGERDPLPPKLVAYLQDYYAESNARLAAFLGHDLRCWAVK